MALLRAAADGTDASLDRALLRIGILAPADLTAIRMVVGRPAAVLVASANRDGHRVVDVVEDGRSVARIHHDGQVVAVARVGASRPNRSSAAGTCR
jgi:hypothetical protein